METDNKFKPLSCQLRNKGHTLREQEHSHCECQRDMPPSPLQFLNQTRPNKFSFKHKRYCFLWVFRNYTNQKFNGFYRVCYNYSTIYDGLSFFLTT